MTDLQLIGVHGMPEIRSGDHLGDLLAEHTRLQDGDVLVVTSKIIAKAEGATAPVSRHDLVNRRRLIESQSVRVLRERDTLMITETRHGFICANAGIDWSNVEDDQALLLPSDPDRSAFKLRDRLRARSGAQVAVVISDAFGRAWRNGVVDVALGCAGIKPMLDDPNICIVDEIAAAAELVMGKTRRVPAVIIRGIDASWLQNDGDVSSVIVRRPADDMFR